MRRSGYLAVPLLLLCVLALAADDKTTLQPKSRAYIVRGLLAEYASVKQTLPLGSEGLKLKTDGTVDERSLQIQLTNFGPAVRPGEVAQITKIEFLKDKIKFEINGGGKKKRKWYQNIELSGPVSGRTTGGPEQQVVGSTITLEFGQTLPDMTADQLKDYLAPVLDFSKKSASLVITDTWPKEIQEAVKNHTITAGMSKDQVLASKGRPDNKIRERKGQVEQETWVYGKVPDRVMLVVFESDEVVEATEYTPGIPATKVPRPGDPSSPEEEKPKKPPQQQF
jgi:hypothetical protein